MSDTTVLPAMTPEEWAGSLGRYSLGHDPYITTAVEDLHVGTTRKGVLYLPDAHFEYGVMGRALLTCAV